MANQPLPYQEHASKLVELGRHREAILVCDKWVEEQPDNPQAWYLKSFCELNTNQAITSLASAQRALELSPDNEQIQVQFATSLIGKGQVKDGMALCRKIAARNDVYPGTLERAATALALAGEPGEAVPLYRKAIQLDPENSRFYSHLATALNQIHQPDLAEEAYRAAIALRPDRFGLFWQLVELRKATPPRIRHKQFARPSLSSPQPCA